MVAFTKLISYILPVIVLILFMIFYFTYEEGGFSAVKDLTLGLKKYVHLGTDISVSKNVTLPLEHKRAIDSLLKTIREMQKKTREGQKNCFGEYTPLPPLQEQGTSLQLSYDALSETLFFVVSAGKEGRQQIMAEKFLNVQPCVIAGAAPGGDLIAENFRASFLAPDASLFGAYYSPMRKISISGDDEENIMEFDGRKSTLHDGGWLFAPDAGHICFFPTGENDENGLEEELTEEAKEPESIAQRVSQGKLTLCSASWYAPPGDTPKTTKESETTEPEPAKEESPVEEEKPEGTW